MTSIQKEIIEHEDAIDQKSTELSMKIHSKVVSAEQVIVVQNATEHEKTREMFKRQLEDQKRALEGYLKDFSKNWEGNTGSERRRLEEKSRAGYASLEATRIMLDAVEVSGTPKFMIHCTNNMINSRLLPTIQ